MCSEMWRGCEAYVGRVEGDRGVYGRCDEILKCMGDV